MISWNALQLLSLLKHITCLETCLKPVTLNVCPSGKSQPKRVFLNFRPVAQQNLTRTSALTFCSLLRYAAPQSNSFQKTKNATA